MVTLTDKVPIGRFLEAPCKAAESGTQPALATLSSLAREAV
jgi:hypothetical protein